MLILILLTAVYARDRCLDVSGGGWQLVRHVPKGWNWHPSSDQLAGVNVYGQDKRKAYNSKDAWSDEFALMDFNEFLFATGDCRKWLVMDRDQLATTNTGQKERNVIASSVNAEPHTTISWLRGRAPQDPWIALSDMAGNPLPYADIVYGANKFGAPLADDWAKNVNNHNGANVYIRINDSNPTPVAPRLELCENRGNLRECNEGPSILLGTRIGRVDGSGRTCKWSRKTGTCTGMKCQDITNTIANAWHRCHKVAKKQKIQNNVVVNDFDWGCFYNVDKMECLPELPTDVACHAYNIKKTAAKRKKQCKKIGTLVRGCKWDKRAEKCVEGA